MLLACNKFEPTSREQFREDPAGAHSNFVAQIGFKIRRFESHRIRYCLS